MRIGPGTAPRSTRARAIFIILPDLFPPPDLVYSHLLNQGSEHLDSNPVLSSQSPGYTFTFQGPVAHGAHLLSIIERKNCLGGLLVRLTLVNVGEEIQKKGSPSRVSGHGELNEQQYPYARVERAVPQNFPTAPAGIILERACTLVITSTLTIVRGYRVVREVCNRRRGGGLRPPDMSRTSDSQNPYAQLEKLLGLGMYGLDLGRYWYPPEGR
ncbi:hypothetical protein GGX14DRAFT_408670 [Mycena pura]|uniref:Uncharacterized protein n=1 Tax=Mycena pura TaxID=153505 RepID=A0AAD6XZ97_9AGAR|nr:hypothetical protein GGX14DRAFT_408670 [Mycena pura]